MTNQDVEASAERNFLKLVVDIVEGLEEKAPHVCAGASAVVGVEPGVDDEDGSGNACRS